MDQSESRFQSTAGIEGSRARYEPRPVLCNTACGARRGRRPPPETAEASRRGSVRLPPSRPMTVLRGTSVRGPRRESVRRSLRARAPERRASAGRARSSRTKSSSLCQSTECALLRIVMASATHRIDGIASTSGPCEQASKNWSVASSARVLVPRISRGMDRRQKPSSIESRQQRKSTCQCTSSSFLWSLTSDTEWRKRQNAGPTRAGTQVFSVQPARCRPVIALHACFPDGTSTSTSRMGRRAMFG